MIRKLTEQDRRSAGALLGQEPALNLYFLANLDQIGFDQPFCEFWGDFAADGGLRAVINRYHSGWILYGLPGADWPGLGALVDAHPVAAKRLQDNPGGIATFLPYLRGYRAVVVSEEELMALHADDFRPAKPRGDVTVRRATLADLAALVAFYAHADQMARPPERVEYPLRHRRIWLAEAGGQVLSTALTNGETLDRAMVGGVYTQPSARGRGLSSAVMSALCQELLAEGRQPVLYWENPAAGRVYRRLGFHPLGTWRSVRLAKVTHASRSAGHL